MTDEARPQVQTQKKIPWVQLVTPLSGFQKQGFYVLRHRLPKTRALSVGCVGSCFFFFLVRVGKPWGYCCEPQIFLKLTKSL